MYCITKAILIHFINDKCQLKNGKSRKFCLTNHAWSTVWSKFFVVLYFREFREKIYCHENIIVNTRTLLTFCGNSDHCLLAFRENLNANILF